MTEVLRHRKPEQVSRNFVALLQLCNTRNVEIEDDDSVLLLSDGFKLAAEIPTDGYSDLLSASATAAAAVASVPSLQFPASGSTARSSSSSMNLVGSLSHS